MNTPKPPLLLFGTSANPLHAGHVHVVNAVRQFTGIAHAHLLLTPGHNLKNPADYLPFPHRMAIARHMVENDPTLIVSDFEASLTINDEEGRTKTVLDAWRNAHPNHTPVWLMGADSWLTFHQWGGAAHIVATTPLLIVNRNDIDEMNCDTAVHFQQFYRPTFTGQAGWSTLTIPPHPASATAIRAALAAGESSPYLTPAAQAYIRQHQLLP
ncbi:MAG: hypothetical protein WAX89_00740 [Alphaproteobacteria bacterium]